MSPDAATVDAGRCAMVEGLLRGRGTSSRVDQWVADHLRHCAPCRGVAHGYSTLARDLEALREVAIPEDPRLLEAISRTIDEEIARQFRRTWALITVASGLVMASAVARALRARAYPIVVAR